MPPILTFKGIKMSLLFLVLKIGSWVFWPLIVFLNPETCTDSVGLKRPSKAEGNGAYLAFQGGTHGGEWGNAHFPIP